MVTRAYLKAVVFRSGFVAHYGLQRSGTNYLRACLEYLRIFPLNAAEAARTEPRHKHFRWQADKRTIPPFIAQAYGNAVRADGVSAVNERARYPSTCRHIVIAKDLASWLVSIMNWGLECGWFDTKDAALDARNALTADYGAYYEFWRTLETREPHRVAIVRYEAISAAPSSLIDVVRRLRLRPQRLDQFTGRFERLPMSPADRRKLVDLADLDAAAVVSAAQSHGVR